MREATDNNLSPFNGRRLCPFSQHLMNKMTMIYENLATLISETLSDNTQTQFEVTLSCIKRMSLGKVLSAKLAVYPTAEIWIEN